jgi:hypothetical protein
VPTTLTWPLGTATSACVLTDLGDLAGARTHHERALEIGQATRRPDHPTIATFRDNLDHALQQLGGEECKGDW